MAAAKFTGALFERKEVKPGESVGKPCPNHPPRSGDKGLVWRYRKGKPLIGCSHFPHCQYEEEAQ